MIQPLWRIVRRFLKELKIELPYGPAIPVLGIYPEKTIIQKESCTKMFIAALFTIARTWEQPKMSINKLMVKDNIIFQYKFHFKKTNWTFMAVL